MVLLITVAIISYLIGAIPSGWLVARCAGIDDITKYGSGNIGATNVARIAGLKYFFLVFFLDCAKSYLFLSLLNLIYYDVIIILFSAIALLVGNGISYFLNGKGGKGVATSVGILLAVNSWLLSCVFIIWLCTILITKNMGISSVAALLSLPIFAFYLMPSDSPLLPLILFISCWGIWRHETNIRKFLSWDKVSI
jgi:acyl phosphate:glycerol-3-phosphate acyltransferase